MAEEYVPVNATEEKAAEVAEHTEETKQEAAAETANAAAESAEQSSSEPQPEPNPASEPTPQPEPSPAPQPSPEPQAGGQAEAGKQEPKERRWRGPRLRYDDEESFSRDEEIISRLRDEDLLKYLAMEQEKEERRQQAKEIRERRIFAGFQLTVSLAAIVAIVGFLKDDPTVLVNILYIIGILTALWIWKHPKDK